MVVQVVLIELENVYHYYIIYTYDKKYVSSWIKTTVCSWKRFRVLLISTLFALHPTRLLLRFICSLYTSRIINLQQIPITSTNFKVNNKEQEARYRKCSISEFTDLSILFQYRDSLNTSRLKYIVRQILYDFDRASSLICGNKMPPRCNRGFYCRSYCLLNMFRAPLCPSSGAPEYYMAVAACGISCCGFQVAGLVWSWGLCVRFAGCCSILQTGHITHITCWASSKICNKNLCCI